MKLREKIYNELLKLIEDYHIPEGKSTENCADSILKLVFSEIEKVIYESQADVINGDYTKEEKKYPLIAYNNALKDISKAIKEALKV